MVKADLDPTLKMSSTPHMKRETNSARWKPFGRSKSQRPPHTRTLTSAGQLSSFTANRVQRAINFHSVKYESSILHNQLAQVY